MSPRTFVLAILGVIFFKYSLSFTVNQVKKAYKPFRTTSSIQLHFHAPAFLVLTRISDSFNDLKDKFNSLPTMSYNDFQNAAIIGAGLTFLAVEKRPIGGVRDDLVEVRKSALIKNNLGVFSKAFIPEGTVIGTYPGYIRSMQGVFDHKLDDSARLSAARYLWVTGNGDVLDPTNPRGLVELELKYLGGLIKVSTTLARMNEPPKGSDVNCIVKMSGATVTITTERNIFSNEELFIDYGPSFDRRDYSQNLSPPIPEKSDDADGKRLRIQPIVLSKDSAESNQSDIPVSPSPARRDSFLGQLTAHEAKYAKSGILSPVEASKRFNMQGEAIFASAEDQQLIDSLYGKPTKTTTITTPTAADVAKSAGVDTLIPDSLVGRLLDRNIVDSVDILAAGKDDAVVDIGIGKSRSKVSAGPKIARSSIFDQRRPRDTLSPERASVSEVQNPTMEVLGGSSSDPIMGPEQAASLQRKLDSLSDEEVEEVFRRLSSTAMQKLVQQGLQRRKNVRKNVGSALSNSEDTSSNNSNDASSITSGSTSGTPLSVPPLDATVREKYEAELGEVQKVLEELREDPMALWRELLQNPEKYTDEDGNPLPTS